MTTDKKDLEIQEKLIRPENEIPYRFGGRYAQKEIAQIGRFMHESFPHLTYGGGRHKEIIVEYPPEEICTRVKWKDILDKVLLPELQNLHPSLKQRKIIARFTDKLYDYQKKVTSGGNVMTADTYNEEWIRLIYKDTSGENHEDFRCVFDLMHELTETDFWEKTVPNDEEAYSGSGNDIDIFKSDDNRYRNLLDEKIANRRALRAIKRYWPKANWINPDDIYTEDRT